MPAIVACGQVPLSVIHKHFKPKYLISFLFPYDSFEAVTSTKVTDKKELSVMFELTDTVIELEDGDINDNLEKNHIFIGIDGYFGREHKKLPDENSSKGKILMELLAENCAYQRARRAADQTELFGGTE